jgi:hypothetical protein
MNMNKPKRIKHISQREANRMTSGVFKDAVLHFGCKPSR